MTRLLFQESQVSRDFEATLNIVLSISCHEDEYSDLEYQKGLNDAGQLLKLSSPSRVDSNSNSENLLKTSNADLNNITSEWKSFDDDLDGDVKFEVASEDQSDPPIFEENDQTSSENRIENDKTIPKIVKDEIHQPGDTQSKVINSGFISKLKNLPSFFIHLTPQKMTDLIDKPFMLPITMGHQDTVDVKVWNNFTIGKVIHLLSELKSLSEEAVSLYLHKTRLESNKTLTHYNVNPKSNIRLKVLVKIECLGKFEETMIPILIYTSETVFQVKKQFSKVIEIIPESLELRLNGLLLDDANQIFLYTINPKSIIDINKKHVKTADRSSNKLDTSLGLETSQSFQRMASNLKSCNCNEIRLEALSNGILSNIDLRYNKQEFYSVLKQFAPNLHLMSCSKAEFGNSLSTNKSKTSSELISSEEVSLDDCIHAELRRIENMSTICIEESDLEYLSNTTSFKDFKRFLRKRIGTECNLRSVAMLYNYARKLVQYINRDGTRSTEVSIIIKNIKLYFQKYFEKNIITKGGLAALALSGSDIEE